MKRLVMHACSMHVETMNGSSDYRKKQVIFSIYSGCTPSICTVECRRAPFISNVHITYVLECTLTAVPVAVACVPISQFLQIWRASRKSVTRHTVQL